MILKLKKNRKGIVLLVIAIFQVFLLVNMITANSYIIHQADVLIENSTIINKGGNKFKDLINSGINLLVGFLSIKQIGIVSATEEVFWCCEVLASNNASCQLIPAGEDSLCEGRFWMTDCQSTDLCKTGTCIDEEAGTCSVGTKKKCDDDGGDWEDNPINEVSNCESGCCTLDNGAYKQWMRKIKCTKEGGVFDSSTPQQDCRIYTEEMGACVLDGGNCKFVTEENCVENLGGNPHLGILCSNSGLETNCGRPLSTGEIKTDCYNDKVYFLDNCSNIANVYHVSKWNVPSYWETVQNSSCGDGKESPTCGNCDTSSSKCAPSSETVVDPDYGDYACKDLTCVDNDFETEYGRPPKNGEAWCVYESHVGNSKDVVGSQHWKMFCDEGKVKYDPLCEPYRGRICSEKEIPLESGGVVSIARCRFNEGWKGFQIEAVPYEYDEDDCSIINQEEVDEYIAECNTLSDNRIQSVDLYKKDDKDIFKFDVCVPKYPPGLKFWDSGSNAKDVCGIMDPVSCPTVWKHGLLKWNCKINCECLNQKFANQMNDLCISLGDCGGYVNVEGEYAKNFKTFNINKLSESKYKNLDDYDADGDIDGDKKTTYISYAAQTGEGDLPQFLSSAEKGYLGGDPLEDIEWLGEDFRFLGNIVTAGIVGVVTVVILVALKVVAFSLGPIGLALAAAVAAVLGFLKLFFPDWGKTKEITIEFKCKAWKAPPGGDDCDECDDDPLRPCTEYKCRSLGTACRIIKEVYETENPVCINKYPNDATPPQIVFDHIEGNYTSTEGTNNVQITDCIQEFTPINLTLKTEDENGDDDYAKCVYNWGSVALDPATDYALEGEDFKEGNFYSITHTFEGRLPFVSSLDYATGNLGEREGELNMYVRCMDYAGNPNFNEYVVKFCIKEGPDNTIAEIKEFTPESGSFLKYNITASPLQILLDEPADCKWSYGTDKSYDDMENFIFCEDYDPGIIKSRWGCTTALTGLTASVNNIYIKCKDQPWISEEGYDGPWTEEDRNVNNDGFLYTLYSTETPLQISSISPQGNVIRGGSAQIDADDLEVTTSGGMANGVSKCKYDFIEPDSSWDFFAQEDTYHIYLLHPEAGNYNILIICEDKAGNKAEGNAVFNLIVDEDAPIVVRVYKEGGSLKLKTNEDAKCYYSLKRCNFGFDDENIVCITSGFSTEHSAKWNSGQTYYIVCVDYWGNKDCKKIIPSS